MWTLGESSAEHEVLIKAEGAMPVYFTAIAEVSDLTIPANITENITLSNQGQPYMLSSSVSVSNDAIMTTELGVTILASEGTALRIRRDGAIREFGTSDAPIRFIGEDEVADTWADIAFDSSSPKNEFAFAEVAFGVKAIGIIFV